MSFHNPANWYVQWDIERVKEGFELDPEIGMPSLPEGWVWRVRSKDDDWYGPYFIVEAIRPRKRWFPKVEWQNSTYRLDLNPTSRYYEDEHPFASMPAAEIVLRLALHLVSQHNYDVKAALAAKALRADWDTVEGLYPPKSL